MTTEECIDHEIRIRMLETTNKQLITKLNALITIAVTGVVVPVIIKYLGF